MESSDRARGRPVVLAAAAVVLVAVAVWVFAGRGRDAPEPLPDVRAAASITEGTSGGQPTVLARPKDGSSGRVVVYLHGAGGSEWSPFARPSVARVTTALLRSGFAVAASRADGDNWGNAAGLHATRALIADLRAVGLGNVSVIAESMGGLLGMRLLDRTGVRGWVGIYPVCDLRSMAGTEFRTTMRQAWGARLRDALDRMSPIVGDKVGGVPMLFFASPGDRIVDKAENTDRCAAAARRRGADVRVVTTRGDHGDPSNFAARRITDFLRDG